MNPEFSLILPCYNEAEHLINSFPKILNEVKKLKKSFEIILIDDKSTDNTRKILTIIKKKYNREPINFFYHSSNKGRGVTVTEGINISKGKIVGFIDVDCEISPKYISLFINKLNYCDVVVAKRTYEFKLSSLHRWIASKIYALLIKTSFKLPISDSEAGYKFFNKAKIFPILKKVKNCHWFWDTEILVRGHREQLRLKEIPVIFIRREDKTSTVRILPDTIEYLRSIIKLRKELIKA